MNGQRTVHPITAPYQPHRLTALDVAIGTTAQHLMPPWHAIPLEFRVGSGKDTSAWRLLVVRWLAGDGEEIQLVPLPGIDLDLARRHIAIILGAPGVPAEYKVAACAYLCFLWFDDAVLDGAA